MPSTQKVVNVITIISYYYYYYNNYSNVIITVGVQKYVWNEGIILCSQADKLLKSSAWRL